MLNTVYQKYMSYLNYMGDMFTKHIYDLSSNFINYIYTEYSRKFLFKRPLDGYVLQNEFMNVYPDTSYEVMTRCMDFINMYVFLCPFNIISQSYISYGGKILVNDPYLITLIMDEEDYFECMMMLGFFKHIKTCTEEFNMLFYDTFLDNYIGINNLLMSYDSVYNGFPTNLDNDLRYTEIKPILDKTYRDTWQDTIRKLYMFLDRLDAFLREDTANNHIYYQPNSMITLDDYEEYAKVNYNMFDSIQNQAYDLSSYVNVLPEHRATAAECIGNYISEVLSSMFPDVSPYPTDDDPSIQTLDNIVFIFSLKDIIYDMRTIHTASGSNYSNVLAPNLLEIMYHRIGPLTINGKLFVEPVQWEDFIEIVNNVITYYFIMILAHTISRYIKFDNDYITNRIVAHLHHTMYKEAIQNGRIHS